MALLVVGCGAAAPRQPPGKAPQPQTVTRAEPGGDAHDPHFAALQRQLQTTWGARNDKDDQIHAPTPDWKNWKRVRYWGVQHFTGFRYGDDHHVMAVVFVHSVEEGDSTDSASCMSRFEAWARPQLREYEVHLGPIRTKQQRWRGRDMLVKQLDGYVDLALERKFVSVAWVAYPEAYPDACLIYSVVVPWRGHQELAQRVRDRWVREGFRRMRPLTPTRPFRQ